MIPVNLLLAQLINPQATITVDASIGVDDAEASAFDPCRRGPIICCN